MYYMTKNTPAGELLLTSDGKNVTGIHWQSFKRCPVVSPDWIEDETVFQEPLKQLDEYFQGKRRTFTFPYTFHGTDFQKRVWHALEHIPYGETSSYQKIASSIGKPHAVRAVGTAIGSNPISIAVPCHRVLRTDGGLGGYAGGLASKRLLLRTEEV
ncbi:methylated-DNA--protein-cysteine methyltransferase [candidate division TM7 genomosp. GTL1]|nr:methylated-DNA--protein-cysteine methyltransferase [candidate division TM7 genomosp. GTL1]